MYEEINHWKKAKEILDSHEKKTVAQARVLIPNQDHFVKEGLMKNLKWEPLDYKITPGMYEPLKKKKRDSMIIQGETGSLLKEIEECKDRS